jgi:hypothetical protein
MKNVLPKGDFQSFSNIVNRRISVFNYLHIAIVFFLSTDILVVRLQIAIELEQSYINLILSG